MGPPSSAAGPLFDAALLPTATELSLPPGHIIRPLQRSDYQAGVLDCLRGLTTVGDPTEAQWAERYEYMAARNDTYFVIVVEQHDGDSVGAEVKNGDGLDGSGVGSGAGHTGTRIVGTGAVVVERKFIRNLGLVGHIEDIAVAKDQQGKRLGIKIIQALDCVASRVGCYKSILDCSEANEGFYVKCGFKRAGLEMSHYYNQ